MPYPNSIPNHTQDDSINTNLPNKGDMLFDLFSNFDESFIQAVADRSDNTPPQEREPLD